MKNSDEQADLNPVKSLLCCAVTFMKFYG